MLYSVSKKKDTFYSFTCFIGVAFFLFFSNILQMSIVNILRKFEGSITSLTIFTVDFIVKNHCVFHR